MALGMRVMEHLIEVVAGHMTQQLKTGFLQKLHHIMVDVTSTQAIS